MSYILNPWLGNLNKDFMLKNCFFGSVKLTINADRDQYIYSRYGIGFDSRSEFSFTDGKMRKNVIVSGIDMSSSVHISNKNKGILILGERQTQGLDDTTLKAEAKYTTNFKQPRKRFVIRLHYNGSNNFLFVNTTKIYHYKAKHSELKDYKLRLGNISKGFTNNNVKIKQD